MLLSLAAGAALALAIARTTGKLTGENALLRGLRRRLKPGDILLADSYYSSYPEVAALLAMGVDVVIRQRGGRPSDFRRGERLGREDHLIRWQRGRNRRPRMSREAFAAPPRSIAMRELRERVDKPGFRTKVFVVVTSLMDAEAYAPREMADLFRQRWSAELDIRSLEQTLRMDVLRCKTPEIVRKVVFAHLIAYNLVRGVIAEAASRHGVKPRRLSFQGARQVLKGFRGELARAPSERAAALRDEMLPAIAGERVGDRLDRYEPSARKRREKMYSRLEVPRRLARRLLARVI